MYIRENKSDGELIGNMPPKFSQNNATNRKSIVKIDS